MLEEDWNKIYKAIKFDFPELTFHHDSQARDILYSLIPEDLADIAYQKMRSLIFAKDVLIVGAGLDNTLLHSFPKMAKDYVIMACDGACVALNKVNIKSDVLVTDLDAPFREILNNLGDGAVVMVHGHGDNLNILEESVIRFIDSGFYVMPTTQVEAKGHVRNLFGFTDGDRAVFAAIHFYPSSITLVGYNFTKVGKYSYHRNEETKKKKLVWAKRLIDMASKECSKKGIQFKIL